MIGCNTQRKIFLEGAMNESKKNQNGGSHHMSQLAASWQTAKDPVCGMYIPQESAIRAREQFFCSEACKRKFIET